MTETHSINNHQKEAIDFIIGSWKKRMNPLCALDVGMGKTLVACEILRWLFKLNRKRHKLLYALVCCPTIGLIETIWKETLEALNLKTILLSGEELKTIKMTTNKKLSIPPYTVCLITYNNLIKNIDYLINTPPSIIVFDEYHTLTNNMQREHQEYREAAKRLPGRLRLGMTATPFVNNEMEFVLAYGLLNDTEAVERFYASDMAQKKKLVADIKKKEFWFYRKNPFTSTRSSEWFVSIPMSKEHYEKYQAEKKQCGYNHMRNVHRIGKLSVSPKMAGILWIGKIQAVRSIVSHLPPGDKIVICDNHKETLKEIGQLDFMRPLKPVLYVGGKESENRKNLHYFEEQPERRAFLTTRQKGGEGLNLQVANHLILLNCWYTVKDIIQTLGRIKRQGQEKPVYFYILGYNLFECLGPGKEQKDYILEEDELCYRAVMGKAEMCEEWGIEVRTELPNMKAFYNSSSFETEFNNFLNDIIIKDYKPVGKYEIPAERGSCYKEQSKPIMEEYETEQTGDCEDVYEVLEDGVKVFDEEFLSQPIVSDKTRIEGVIKFGETYLSRMYSEYLKLIQTNAHQQSEERRKVVAVRRKPKKP